MLPLLLTAALAAPCEPAVVTERLAPGVVAAGAALGREDDAMDLLTAQVAHILQRCAVSRTDRDRVQAALDSAATDPFLVAERVRLFLEHGSPATWLASHSVEADGLRLALPPIIAHTWLGRDGSAPLDMLGLDRLRITVRPGLPVPEGQRPRRAPRHWTPPERPRVELVHEGDAVWTTSCWAPAWADAITVTVCDVAVPTGPEATAVIPVPGTAWGVTGPASADAREYGTLRWPAYGVTVRVLTYRSLEDAQLHADAVDISHIVGAAGSDLRAVVVCEPAWPEARDLAESLCASAVRVP